MKKVLSLVLALSLCLSLCACGQSKAVKNAEALIGAIGEVTLDSAAAISAAEEAYGALTTEEKAAVNNYGMLVAAKEAQTFLNAEGLLKEGKYEEALELLYSIESYRKVADQIAYAEAQKLEAERLAKEAEYAARPREEVPINLENVETYFEFLVIPYFNGFGQLDQIVCKIFPRDDYIDRMDFESDFLVEIGYKAEGITATVQYDEASNTFTYGEPLPGWGGAIYMDEILSMTNQDFAQLASHKETDIRSPEIQSLGNLWVDTIFHENGMNGCNEWSHFIEQVRGSIVLFADP